jgi:methyl-accepting chemotaxis protein
VDSIRGIGTTIGEISEIAAAIAAAVEEQGAATQEIARNVQQAAAGTQEVSSNIVGVSQGAIETGAAANLVLAEAATVSRQAEQLSSDVGAFLDGLKAA